MRKFLLQTALLVELLPFSGAIVVSVQLKQKKHVPTRDHTSSSPLNLDLRLDVHKWNAFQQAWQGDKAVVFKKDDIPKDLVFLDPAAARDESSGSNSHAGDSKEPLLASQSGSGGCWHDFYLNWFADSCFERNPLCCCKYDCCRVIRDDEIAAEQQLLDASKNRKTPKKERYMFSAYLMDAAYFNTSLRDELLTVWQHTKANSGSVTRTSKAISLGVFAKADEAVKVDTSWRRYLLNRRNREARQRFDRSALLAWASSKGDRMKKRAHLAGEAMHKKWRERKKKSKNSDIALQPNTHTEVDDGEIDSRELVKVTATGAIEEDVIATHEDDQALEQFGEQDDAESGSAQGKISKARLEEGSELKRELTATLKAVVSNDGRSFADGSTVEGNFITSALYEKLGLDTPSSAYSVRVVEHEQRQMRVMVVSKRVSRSSVESEIWIVVRGTIGAQNWKQNFKGTLVDKCPSDLGEDESDDYFPSETPFVWGYRCISWPGVRRGVLSAISKVSQKNNDIAGRVLPLKLHFTGHSLGGGVSLMAGIEIENILRSEEARDRFALPKGSVGTITTYAAPAVLAPFASDGEWKPWLAKVLVRFEGVNDPVPKNEKLGNAAAFAGFEKQKWGKEGKLIFLGEKNGKDLPKVYYHMSKTYIRDLGEAQLGAEEYL
jgi:hypothetical protein